MNTSFSKQEPDLLAERTQQEFNNASSGTEYDKTKGSGVEAPQDPSLTLKPDYATAREAKAEAELHATNEKAPSNSLENDRANDLGLEDIGLDNWQDRDLDMDLGLGR